MFGNIPVNRSTSELCLGTEVCISELLMFIPEFLNLIILILNDLFVNKHYNPTEGIAYGMYCKRNFLCL